MVQTITGTLRRYPMGSSSHVKWRYNVPGPRPACLAMSSKLVFAPDRVNASFATFRMRSRLRWASVRGKTCVGVSRLSLPGLLTGKLRYLAIIQELGAIVYTSALLVTNLNEGWASYSGVYKLSMTNNHALEGKYLLH
jgi:hypothetical protein